LAFRLAKMIVEKQSQVTKHYHVMPAKKLVYRAMVAMPAVFLLGLGVKARTENDSFEFVRPTPKQNAAILAYGGIVRDSANIPTIDSYGLHLEPVRKVAKEWIAESRSGMLQPLQPAGIDDTMRDGIKAEIMMRNSSTASAMLYGAGLEIGRHQYDQGVEDALLGMEVSDVIKYSDYSSVLQGSLYDRRGFRLLAEALPHVSPQTRLVIRRDLALVAPRTNKFAVVEETERHVFIENLHRMTPDSTSIETMAPYDGGGFKALAGHFHGELLASSSDDSVPQSSQLEEMALEGEVEVHRLYNLVAKKTNP